MDTQNEMAIAGALRIARSSEKKVELCRALAKSTGSSAVLAALLEALWDEDGSVRAEAASSIGKLFGYTENPPSHEARRVGSSIADRLMIETDRGVISALLSTLGLVGAAGTEQIAAGFTESTDPRIRRQAEFAVTRLSSRLDNEPRLFEPRLIGVWKCDDSVLEFHQDKSLNGLAAFAEVDLNVSVLRGWWDQPTLAEVTLELEIPHKPSDYVYVTLSVRGRDAQAVLAYVDSLGKECLFHQAPGGSADPANQ